MSAAAAGALGATGVIPTREVVSSEKHEAQPTSERSEASTLAGEGYARNEQGGQVDVKDAEARFEVSFLSVDGRGSTLQNGPASAKFVRSTLTPSFVLLHRRLFVVSFHVSHRLIEPSLVKRMPRRKEKMTTISICCPTFEGSSRRRMKLECIAKLLEYHGLISLSSVPEE